MSQLLLPFVIAVVATFCLSRFVIPLCFKKLAIPAQIFPTVNIVLIIAIFVSSFGSLYYLLARYSKTEEPQQFAHILGSGPSQPKPEEEQNKEMIQQEKERQQNTFLEEERKNNEALKRQQEASNTREEEEMKKLAAEKQELERKLQQQTETIEALQKEEKNRRVRAEEGRKKLEQMQREIEEVRSKNRELEKKARQQVEATQALKKEESGRLRAEEEKRKLAAEKQELVRKLQQQAETTEALKKEEEENTRVRAEEGRKKVEQMQREIEEVRSKKQELTKEQAEVIQQQKQAETIKERFVIRPDGTVVDKVTKLMWLKNANYPMRGMNWNTAMKYCEGLNYAGHNDWKLPSKEEWKTLAGNKGIGKTSPKHPFTNLIVHAGYWSSSVSPLGLLHVYVVNVATGDTENFNKSKIAYVWPVRYTGEEN